MWISCRWNPTFWYQATLTYSPLGKPFEKQTKTIEDQKRKHIETLKVSKQRETNKTKNQLNEFFQKGCGN